LPPWEAASAAAWLHGRAAWIAGPGMVAEDIAPALAAAFADAVAFSSATRQEAVRP
jgi:NAD(P)H-hydrate repair Nnr-like enzyme with NAD(P)H-hydrate dehydratase domain